MAFIKPTKVMKYAMLHSGGYRERDIVHHAQCYVSGKNTRYVKVVRKPDRSGERKTALFDMKTCSWRG